MNKVIFLIHSTHVYTFSRCFHKGKNSQRKQCVFFNPFSMKKQCVSCSYLFQFDFLNVHRNFLKEKYDMLKLTNLT